MAAGPPDLKEVERPQLAREYLCERPTLQLNRNEVMQACSAANGLAVPSLGEAAAKDFARRPRHDAGTGFGTACSLAAYCLKRRLLSAPRSHVAAFVTGLGQGPQTGEERLSAGALAWRGDGEIQELR